MRYVNYGKIMTKFDENAKRRIRFLTRRGLLELDIMLKRFMQTEFDALNDDELDIFVAILDLPDQELLAILNQKEQNNDKDFEPVLEKIRLAH